MSTLLAIGLANAACAALLAIPAVLVSRFARRPALAHALWLLVLLKLVTPPLFRPNLPWLPEAAPPQPARVVEEPFAYPLVFPAEPTPVLADTPTPPIIAAAAPPKMTAAPAPVADGPALPAGPPVEAPAAPAEERDPWSVLLVAWLAGVAVCLGRSLWLVGRFRRLLAHARPAPEAMQGLAAEVAREMGLARCPSVWLVPGALPPMVWGVGRVRVLFPAGLAERLAAQECRSLLAHELAHVVRRDHWVRWLELAALSLYWWYPLAWWARRQMQAREEECCDAWAAAQAGPRVYATAILDAVDFLAEARPRLPAVASPLARQSSLKERLTLIMTGPGPRHLAATTRLALLGLAVAVLPLLPALVRSEAAAPPAASADADEPEPGQFASSDVNLLRRDLDTYSVAFSADGTRIAAGDGGHWRSGHVSVWDARTRRLLWSQAEPSGVSSVSFSADGRRLAWSGWRLPIRVLDLNPGRNLQSIAMPARNSRVAHSPDGRWLAVASEDRWLRLLDARTGLLTHSLQGDLVDFYCVNFSPDSRFVAAGGGYFNRADMSRALVWDVLTRRQVARLEGHQRAVTNVAFAPKNALVATASADNTVRVFDGKSFQLRVVLTGHTQGVKGLAFSPDGRLLATGGWDRTVRLWDPVAGKQLAQLDGHPGMVREIAFSPDGRFLVSGGERRSVKLWDVVARKELATLRQDGPPPENPPAPLTLGVSPDGKVVALGGEDGAVVLRDARTGARLRTLKGHDDAVTTVAFTGDGKRLATAGPDTVVKLWDVATGRELQAFKGHTSWVYSLAFSRDGRQLASGSYDRTVRLWDVTRPAAPRVLSGHRASVRALAFTPDGKLLASGGADRQIRVWDVETLAAKHTLRGHEGTVRGLAVTGGTLISTGEDGWLRRWDLASGRALGQVRNYEGQILTLALSPTGRTVAVGTDGGSLMVHDAATLAMRHGTATVHQDGLVGVAFTGGGGGLLTLGGDRALRVWHGTLGPVRLLVGHKGPVNRAVFSPDGKYALSAGGWPEGDRTLRLWEVATGRQIRAFAGNTLQLQSAAFAPDGRHVVAGEDSGVVWMWEARTGRLARKFEGHTGTVPHLVFSADGRQLLSSSNDKTVKLWDVSDGKCVQTFAGHDGWARCAAFLPGGKHVLTGSKDRTLRVWAVDTGKEVRRMTHDGPVVDSLALLPDGKRFLSSGGPVIQLWDLETGQVLRRYAGHQFGVTCVAAHPDGKRFFSCGYDATVRLWDVETGQQLYRFDGHRNWVWSVAVSPDGRQLLSASGGATQNGKHVPGSDFAVRLWPTPGRMVVARVRPE